MSNISIVINTWNNEKTLKHTLESVKGLGEIIIVDMHSTDNTRDIAREYTEHIFLHPYIGYVEPARNAAIEKATRDWVLVLDSDEEVPQSLSHEMVLIAQNNTSDTTHYFIPRKNLIFGTWVKHAGWWPDNQLRFFKRGTVKWQDQIHSIPETVGNAHTFPSEENYALVHHNYTSVSQWIQRMDRYTTIQAKELFEKGYEYSFSDNLYKPFSEFLRRFFVWEGYKDGVTGLNLALLQSLSELIVYMKVKELKNDQKQLSQSDFIRELKLFLKQSKKELHHWLIQSKMTSKLKSLLSKFW